jgi:hypothetical protein
LGLERGHGSIIDARSHVPTPGSRSTRLASLCVRSWRAMEYSAYLRMELERLKR